jgi:hypothetical protein
MLSTLELMMGEEIMPTKFAMFGIAANAVWTSPDIV